MTRAKRFNEGKLRVDLVPPEVIEGLAKVYQMGAAKYGEHNWQNGAPWCESVASLERHLLAWRKREDLDKESELNHLLHVAWNALTLYYYQEYGLGTDNRPERPPSKKEDTHVSNTSSNSSESSGLEQQDEWLDDFLQRKSTTRGNKYKAATWPGNGSN